jgi:CheY-like chemotaxis protein
MTDWASPASARPATALDLSPVVLLAEDDRAVRNLLCETLQSDHFRVLLAANGQEALALAESSMPDLLITDVAMPRLDGVGLIRAVRRLYPDLPIIVTSGDAFYEERPLAEVLAELGVDTAFLKPFDFADLQRAALKVVPRRMDAALGSSPAGPDDVAALSARWPARPRWPLPRSARAPARLGRPA